MSVKEVKREELTNNDGVNNVETPETSEKKGIGYKIGAACGKAATGVTKVVKSKPFKFIATATAVIASAKAGYEYGKRKGQAVDEPCTDVGITEDTPQE